MNWEVDGIPATSALGNSIPTFRRGEEIELELLIDEQTDDGESETTVLGGDDGTTYGGATGGTFSSSSTSPVEIFREYKKYIEYQASHPTNVSLGGDVYVREFLTDDADVESYIVEVSSDVPQVDEMWAAITGGENTQTVPGSMTIQLTLLALARKNEYDTRTALLDDMSTPLSQL